METMYLENCAAMESTVDGVSFYRCRVKAGEAVAPKMDQEKLIVLLFNGNPAYIRTSDDIYNISEPSVFIPDFDHIEYTIQAIEDIEFVLCVFTMNEWDKEFFKGWNLHLPFFSKYSDGVRFNYMGRSKNLGSWSLVQPFQLGHLSLSVICGKGGQVKSDGNPLQNQWIYAVGSSKYQLSVAGGSKVAQTDGDFSFIPVTQPYEINADADQPICYFDIEYFAADDLQKNYLAQIFNGRMTEVQ